MARTCLLCGAPLPKKRSLSGVAILIVASLVASASLEAVRGGPIRAAGAEVHVPPTVGRVALLPSPTARTVVVRLPSRTTVVQPTTPAPSPTSPPATSTATPPPSPTPAPVLPTDTATAAPTALAMYQVREGDYLIGVAQKHGVELQTLLALNPQINSQTTLYVGQSIQVPVAQAEVTAPTDTPEPADTPEPTAPPEPTETPAPTTTPEPTATPAPTDTPEPTATPTETATPEPTATPAPTATPTRIWSNEPGCYFLVNHASETATVTLYSLQVSWQESITLGPGGEWSYCLLPGPYGYSVSVSGEASARTGTFEILGGEEAEWPIY
ncbi:MAG: LysM peptidoglycan-binding domain-containing protein [Anaerolineae bacterium]